MFSSEHVEKFKKYIPQKPRIYWNVNCIFRWGFLFFKFNLFYFPQHVISHKFFSTLTMENYIDGEKGLLDIIYFFNYSCK